MNFRNIISKSLIGILLLATTQAYAAIIYGTGSAGSGSNIDFGIGQMYWTRANTSAGYFYGNPIYGADEVYFGDIARPGFWSNYDSYNGVANIWDFTDASNHLFETQNAISFAESSNNYYRGIMLFYINGFYGALNPLEIDSNYQLSYEFWYDDTGASNFSSLKPVPEPTSIMLLLVGVVLLVALGLQRRHN